MLFPEHGVDEVGVHDGAGEVSEFIEGIVGLEALAPEAGTANGIKGLVDRPASTLGIKGGVEKDQDSVFLIWFKTEVYNERNQGDSHEK